MEGISEENRIPKFKVFLDSTTLSKDWCRWKRSVELYLVARGVSDPKVKQATLLYLGGLDLQDIFYSLTNFNNFPEDSDIYTHTVQLLDEHFCLKSDSVDDLKTKVYWFLIELTGTKPKIWRRIQVPADYTFFHLHCAIQDAMGWRDCHLYEFDVYNPETDRIDKISTNNFMDFYGDYEIFNMETEISKYFRTVDDKASYVYDMGDSWRHQIKLEKIMRLDMTIKYPKCVDGKCACPPEDVGGIMGFENFLKMINDRGSELYQEQKEWLEECGYENFDPNKFDPNAIEFRDPKTVVADLNNSF